MKILDLLSEKRVFEIWPNGEMFDVMECCDNYFGVSLTKEQVLQLAEEIKELAETLG